MTKTYLNPDELEAMVGAELRKDPAYADVKVKIVPVTDLAVDSSWRVEVFLEAPKRKLHRKCRMAAMALQRKLRRQYEAIWPRQ
jgi:hypothetical protein